MKLQDTAKSTVVKQELCSFYMDEVGGPGRVFGIGVLGTRKNILIVEKWIMVVIYG